MTAAITAIVSTLGWAAPLKRAVQVKNGPTLKTLRDARNFIMSNPRATLQHKAWICALGLVLAAAKGGGDIAGTTEKIELALFLESRLVVPDRPAVVLTQDAKQEVELWLRLFRSKLPTI
jgi:hypothetical protein